MSRRARALPAGAGGAGLGSAAEATSPELKLVAMREHSLLSLFELSHELSVDLDAGGIADLALFNLMGHMGTAHAALFLASTSRPGRLEAIRSHGVRTEIARALAAALEPVLPACLDGFTTPLRIEDTAPIVEPAAIEIAARSGIALLAPLVAGRQPIGFVALGRRAGGAEYSDLDLDVLNASLGMVGVAFENRRLFSRLEDQNRDLARANQELRELDQMKSEFLQNVNHELRTPLAVIIGCVDCLMQEPESDTRRVEFLTGVMEHASKLRDMVQTLLDFTSALDGSLDIRAEEFDPRGAVADYFSDRRTSVSATHPEFVLTVDASGLPVRCDPQRMIQVLDALLGNAVKFTPAGTRLELRVLERPTEREAWTRIELRDHGPGIAHEHVSLLFKPFRQADGSTTRRVGGLGMGLAAASRIADLMGCRLTAESEPGTGATFTLLLPRA